MTVIEGECGNEEGRLRRKRGGGGKEMGNGTQDGSEGEDRRVGWGWGGGLSSKKVTTEVVLAMGV